jgi:hypothetical protein
MDAYAHRIRRKKKLLRWIKKWKSSRWKLKGSSKKKKKEARAITSDNWFSDNFEAWLDWFF